MASNPYGIRKAVGPAPEMPSTVHTMAQGRANDDFKFSDQKEIWRMNDKDRTDYWTRLDKFRNQVGDNDSRFKDYRAGLNDTLRADYDSTHLNLTGAPSSTPGFGFYITPEERLRHIQQETAKDFRADIPAMGRGMIENLTGEANRGLSAANRNTEQGYSSRGLLYSGMKQQALAGNRAQTQSAVAQGTIDINRGLQDAADNLDMDAIQTGMGIQQAQQQIQNQVYSQAMARMAAHNQAVGSGLGFITSAGMAYAGGGKK